MKRAVNFAATAVVAATCNTVAAHRVADDGIAVGTIAQVAIVDRSSGVELTPHFYRGEYWVAGKPGATYSIAIRNRMGERLLAVASVDGVNVVSGETAAWDQTGYVFSPDQRYEITGWRKSDAEVAAFTFTESPNSYAERTGRPANVGVIGVALFRERQPEPVYVPPVIDQPLDEARATPPPAPSPAAPAEADEAPTRSQARANDAGSALRRDSLSPPIQAKATPKLGTGHGERQASYVSRTEFVRLQSEPDEIIRIRYDSYDNLTAMGVIVRPRPAGSATNPFPGSSVQQYVPDPPGTNAGAR